MIYQRHIPREELFAAQLEMLMQNSWFAIASMQLIGIVATVMMFWSYMELNTVLLVAAAFLILLLVRSLHMSNALVEHRFRTHPRRLYWQLLAGAAATGSVWSAAYIVAAHNVPVTIQYVFLLLIVMITAFSLVFSVAVREYFIVYLLASLWPIAWWCLAHYVDQPYNLLIGLLLLAFCSVLIFVADQTYKSFRNMISLTWEREHTAQELGELTNSLRDRNRQLQEARRQLTELANVDELTGLGNRRLVNSVLLQEMNRARRSGGELSLILLDVDYFKNYNDNYGHPAGDTVLQKLADIMVQASSRAGEVVTRYGGEEFLLILPGASASSAMRTASRLRNMIEEARIPHGKSEVSAYVTVSQGVVTAKPDSALQPADLVKQVDNALYRAKGAGRNAISA